MNRNRQYLSDLLQQIEYIAEFTREGEQAFLADGKTQYAVIRAYEIIGEIVKRLPSHLLDSQPQIRWADLAGFRDFLIHRYDRVSPAFVWNAVKDLPNLRAALEAMHQMVNDIPSEDQS